MATVERIDQLERMSVETQKSIKETQKLNRAVVKMLGKQDARLEALERHVQYTQKIWVAVAKHLELWDELEEEGGIS